MSLALGAMAFVGLAFSFLALTDIYHAREPDLGVEWGVVRAAFFITFVFVVLASVTLLRLQREG